MLNKLDDFLHHLPGHPSFDYSQITEEIFIGTNMCCQYGFKKELLTKGVRADISLEEGKVDAPIGVDFFLWLPTKDHEAPSPDALAVGVSLLEFLLKRMIKTYIHCKNGHGRAATLYAALLIKQGATLEDAVRTMQARRASIMPTEAQLKALRTFKTSLTPH
jgi:hypothetical protein